MQFDSAIKVRPIAQGKYAGRWEVYGPNGTITDCATEAQAEKAATLARKHLRSRTEADKPLNLSAPNRWNRPE